MLILKRHRKINFALAILSMTFDHIIVLFCHRHPMRYEIVAFMMSRAINLFLILSTFIFHGIAADTCFYEYQAYYCSPGQSCGYYYGDCRGLSTYAITGIVFASVTLLSICIRCCIQCAATDNTRRQPPVATRPTVRTRQAQVRSFQNPGINRTIPVASMHQISEELPPSYDTIVPSSAPPQKKF